MTLASCGCPHLVNPRKFLQLYGNWYSKFAHMQYIISENKYFTFNIYEGQMQVCKYAYTCMFGQLRYGYMQMLLNSLLLSINRREHFMSKHLTRACVQRTSCSSVDSYDKPNITNSICLFVGLLFCLSAQTADIQPPPRSLLSSSAIEPSTTVESYSG